MIQITRKELSQQARNLSRHFGGDYQIKQTGENFSLLLGGIEISDVCNPVELYYWIAGYRSGIGKTPSAAALDLPPGVTDPLTDKERGALIRNFASEFLRKYGALLSILPQRDFGEHNHIPAKVALHFAALEFMPSYPGLNRDILRWKAMI